MTVIQIDKYQMAKIRAKERSKKIMESVVNDPTYVETPPELGFSINKMEKMIEEMLYEIEKINERD